MIRGLYAVTGGSRVHFLGGCTMAKVALSIELSLDASGDSGRAVLQAAHLPGGQRGYLAAVMDEVETKLAAVQITPSLEIATAGGRLLEVACCVLDGRRDVPHREGLR